MKINSTRLGEQEIDDDSVLTFPQGIPGFEQYKQYKLFHEEGKPTVFWLQSLDDADLTFSLALPELFNIAYEFVLSDEEIADLQLDDLEDVAVLILLSKPGEEVPAKEEVHIQGHLRSPMVFNLKKRRAMQKVLHQMERHTLIREGV